MKAISMQRGASRSLAMLALALLLAVITSATTRAQAPLCTPDCELTPFMGPYTFIACIKPPPCPNCVRVKITYFKRNACGVWWDIQVTDVESIDPVYSECYGVPIKPSYYFQQALLAMMTDPSNPTGFPPTIPGECATNWRVSTGACQRIEGYNPDVTHPSWWYFHITPCDRTCCLTPFTVCLGTDGVTRTARPSGGPVGSGNCPVWDPQNWGEGGWGETCVEVCGWASWNY